MKKLIIFTDLDGTLLDYSNYSFEAALPALNLIKEKNIPIILCSSKTRREIEHYRTALDSQHPFIAENGGGIFIPKNYFKFQIPNFKSQIEESDEYQTIRLGAKYSDLRKTLQELRSEGFDVRGFGDMTDGEIMEATELSAEEAAMAKERYFDEPFFFLGGERQTQRLLENIKEKGFNYTKGKFFHMLGNSDKGKAVSILIDLYKRNFGEITTVAIGDSPNDIPMLERVDYPAIVQKPDGSYDTQINISNLKRVDGIGPEGWNKIIIDLITKEFISKNT